MNDTNWLPGLVVIGVGTIAGMLLALRHRGVAPEADPRTKVEHQRDLLARKDELVALIRELDDTRDTREPAVYAAERARLEQEAAETLRRLETVDIHPPPSAGAAPIRDRHPMAVGMVWGAGLTAFIAATAFGLYTYSKPRAEGMSVTGGESAMGGGGASAGGMGRGGGMGGGGMGGGGMASAMPTQKGPPTAEELALEAAVKANPGDLEAKNKLGHAKLANNDLMGAFRLAEEVVKADGENSEARTHQGVVLMSIGDLDMAGQVLDRVLVRTPDQAEALGYRGAVYWQKGDVEGAIRTWQKAKEAVPAEAATFDKLILMAKQGPPVAAPSAGGQATEAASGTPELTGQILLADGLPAQGTLYIYVRPAGVDGGPPARVKRLPASFPASFSISAADSPMGGVLSGKVQISARLDADGNAMTKEPDAPAAKSEPLDPGATGITLTLQRP